MKKIAMVVLLGCLMLSGSVFAEGSVDVRLLVVQNDMIMGGHYRIDFQIRITSGTSPRTLALLSIYIYCTPGLEGDNFNWTFDTRALGYSAYFSGHSWERLDGMGTNNYLVIMLHGFKGAPGVTPVNGYGGGSPAGWDVTTDWQTIARLNWIIRGPSIHIDIVDQKSDFSERSPYCLHEAAYFINHSNEPPARYNSWTVTTQDQDRLGDQTLPVQMSNVSAVADRLKGAVITWETQSEVDCAGFYVWRSESEGGEYSKITSTIIPGRGNSSSAYEYDFSDRNVKNGVLYWYKIEEISSQGSSQFFGPISVEGVSPIPTKFDLSQNYPNPFNPTTKFEYTLPINSHVSIRVFDLLGKEVMVLVNEQKEAGYYTIQWDGKNSWGNQVSSGIYIAQIQAGDFTAVRKLSLMR